VKKRQRIPNNNPYYSNEPAVSRKVIADQSLTQNASLGNAPPKAVDKKPGRASGIAGFKDTHRPKAAKANLKPAPVPTAKKLPQQGSLKAHRIGKR
jgi:hypothetical protein